MPTYHYQCQDQICQTEFKEFQNMSDDKLVTCPECNKDTLERLIGPGAGIVFKGDFPGQSIRRKAEDNSLFNKAKVTRRRKNSGEIPKDAVVHEKDVDLSTYNGPKNLPKGHPERGGI